jgi:DNA polymerase elongation subunit (family B)
MYKSSNQRKCIIDIETSDYLPWNGSKIICIGIMNLSTSTKHMFYNENEAKLLSSFIEYFESKDFTNIIGYNVAFDVRFLFSRCLKYQLSAKTLYRAKITDLIKIVSLSVQEEKHCTHMDQLSSYFQKEKLMRSLHTIIETWN